ncbi:motility associated factor glycosyltransferase family protein [Helicobacter sp. 23-1045]
MTIWEKNLGAIGKVDLALYQTLQKVTPNTDFEVFIGADSADINILDKRRESVLFSGNSVESTTQIFNALSPYQLYPYLYFFGLGNGILYKMLLSNPAHKQILVFEPNVEIIFIVLNLIDFSDDILAKRFILFDANVATMENLSPFFSQNRAALMHSKLYNLHFFNAYYDNFLDLAGQINKLFVSIIEHCVVSLGNDSNDAITGIKHHIANLPLMLKNPTLYELIGKAKNTDCAVIVSTGPSLYKQLPLLKKMQDFVTIFCIDASFPILCEHGIKPDIVLSMERVELTAKFYEVVDTRFFENVIFAITSIAHKKLLDEIVKKGGILQISQRPFGYTSYFGLESYGYVGIGLSAANMAYEIVVHSGFEKCVFIGQDLAFAEDGTSHSKGAVYGESEIGKERAVVRLEKYGGGGFVQSTQVWDMFLKFFAKDIFDTKDRICAINATEGGARIPHTIEMPFEKAMSSVDNSTKKAQITLEMPSESETKANLKKAKQKTQELLKYGNAKKAKIEALFLEVAGLCEALESANKEGKLEEFDFKKLDSTLESIEKIKGLFKSQKFLQIFNEATQSYIFHQEMELVKITTKIANDEISQKAKKLEWLFAHKMWLFSLAGCMDAVLYCASESSKY